MTKKMNHLGDDPLAWLSQGTIETKSPPPAVRRNRARNVEANLADNKAKTDTELVEESFALIAKKGKEIVADFYLHLFDNYPELAPMFDGVSKAGQQKKLLAALVMLVENLRQPDMLEEYLKELGERHQSYGVQEADYDKVTYSLLSALKKHAGPNWTPDVERAWIKTLTAVKEIMTSAYAPDNDETGDEASQLMNTKSFVSFEAPRGEVEQYNQATQQVEELSSSVAQHSDLDQRTHFFSADVRTSVERSLHSAQYAIQKMNALSSSGKKIAETIELVDDIAFQTNLMALNATVEAARAGEQGRGLAVIAAEIRQLAQQSAAAIKEIKGMLNDNGEQLRQGAESIIECEQSMRSINDDIK